MVVRSYSISDREEEEEGGNKRYFGQRGSRK